MLFDYTVLFVANDTFIRAAPITCALIWLWTQHDIGSNQRRESIIATLAATIGALAFIKILRYFLPFRPRPLANRNISFTPPWGVDINTLSDWNSFPSDTATFFFTVSTGLFIIARVPGFVALFYSFLVACLSRVYLGYHYPTDIIAGMVVGILFAYVATRPHIKKVLAKYPVEWLNRKRQAFYILFFLAFLELTNVFEDVRRLLSFITKISSN